LLVEGRHAAPIADRDRFQDIAVIVDREGQRMADAGIGGITLVVIVEGFA
jgi:hypothetical protein